MSLTMPSVSLPFRWSAFKTIFTLSPLVMEERVFPFMEYLIVFGLIVLKGAVLPLENIKNENFVCLDFINDSVSLKNHIAIGIVFEIKRSSSLKKVSIWT